MVINKLDGIEFRLQESHDFTWLKRYGTAFWVVDETGSGCVCIGMQQGETKYFCKIAGVNTLEADVSPQESVEVLKNAVSIYRDLEHPNLIKLVDAYAYENLFVAVFEWAEGECLFDHWNFEKYQKNGWAKSPKERFKNLPAEEKLQAVDVLFSFLQSTNEKGYIAVDFYDGSIIYDFENKETTICDIDFFRKAPVINDMGADWPGTKRLKAPEKYELNSSIDAQTNVFTLGALLFEFFGSFTGQEMEERYRYNRFLPCNPEKIEDLGAVLDDITAFYRELGSRASIYHPFKKDYFRENEEVLKAHGYTYTPEEDHRVMLLTEGNQIEAQSRLDIRVLNRWDEKVATDILVPSKEPWEVEVTKRRVAAEGSYLFVGYLDGEAVVYTDIHRAGDDSNTRFDYIVTNKKHRGKGYASELLSFVVEYCKENSFPMCWQWAGPSEPICYRAGFREAFTMEGGFASGPEL